ncbi:hypothetical protein DOK78_000295 [Enterococcus sp. DIV2402]|jgi:hypothetical protein|uniref:Transposase n=1 Tax=Candidatus Enterococcus lowellii TaxID=2230877 RepID=A0ABZ2SIL6_9ENTE
MDGLGSLHSVGETSRLKNKKINFGGKILWENMNN